MPKSQKHANGRISYVILPFDLFFIKYKGQPLLITYFIYS